MRTALALAAFTLLGWARAQGQPIALAAPVTHFAAAELGGIRTIVRYAVARPDRTEVDYLLLGEPSADIKGAPPLAIQIEGPHGDPAILADVQGADCTLSQTAILRVGRHVVLISAVRAEDAKQVLAGALSQPGPMDVTVYRARPGGEPGESTPVFTAEPTPTRTKAVCAAAQVQQAIDAVSHRVAAR